MHTRIVRQVIRHRLVAMPEIARAIRRIHHLHGRGMTLLRRTVLGGQRQRILDLGHVFLKDRQIAALFFVTDQDRRAVRRLHAQQVVEISLIRGEDDIELRIIQLQPGNVAGVVVVRRKRVGAQAQEAGKSCVVAEFRGVAQRLAHRADEFLVSVVIRHAHQPAAAPLHHRIRIVNRGFVFRMLLDVLLDLRARKVLGIECMTGRHRLAAGERPVFIQQIPAAAVDHQQPLQDWIGRGPVEPQPFRVALPPEDIVQIA